MWPSLVKELQEYRKKVNEIEIPNKSEINRIFIFGMGGSGIVGKIFENLSFLELNKEIRSFNTTKIPRYITNEDLAIVISYSGNTLETLNVFKELKSKEIKHICITSDGILKSMSRNVLLIPKDLLPREAFPYMFLSLLAIFEKIFSYPAYPIVSIFEQFKSAIENIDIKLKEEPVLIYSWYHYYPAALRFKQALNENTKIQAYALHIPEACHNDIEGVKKGTVIVLRGSKEDEDVMEAFINVLPKKPVEIKIKNRKYLSEILLMFYLADLISIKEAKRRGIDWRDTPRIIKYKKELYKRKSK